MNRFWDILGIVFFLVALFLLLFYFKGAEAIIGAGGRALTSTINALQGKDSFGNLPSTYPR